MDSSGKFLLEDGEKITLSDAKNRDGNMIAEIGYIPAARKLFERLLRRQDAIRSLVRHHMQLGDGERCIILPMTQWMKGAFNVCIPVEIGSDTTRRKLIMRCCLPFKCAEAQYPGTIDEKMSCEVATYAWMQENCKDVRIPHLYGFGFTDHRQYTHEKNRPWYLQLLRKAQRFLNNLLRRDMLSYYMLHPSTYQLPTAYMLLEHIGPDVGEMLCKTWSSQLGDVCRRARLFRGIARTMLSLARIPQPRIGSFQFHDDCRVRLTNRPLTCTTIILENDNTPRAIERMKTYTCTESFASDMLSFHDNRLLSHPNVIIDEQDCREAMATRTVMRALSHKYISKEFRDGPFLLQYTDFHAANIFVDKDWNVTCIVDLEWICALPVEMLHVPHWLTGHAIDGIDKHYSEFDQVRKEFMGIFQEEEKAAACSNMALSKIMENMWVSKGVWFWFSISSVNAMCSLVPAHIYPHFGLTSDTKLEKHLSSLWCEESSTVVDKKVVEFKEYEEALEKVFEKP